MSGEDDPSAEDREKKRPRPSIETPGEKPATSQKCFPELPSGKALAFEICGRDKRARASNLRLPHGGIQTPVFMPVGTHGVIKGITSEQMEELDFEIMLGNTYHLANRPTTPLLQSAGGLHEFMRWPRNLLTDSGGFQMVSLAKLSKVTEEGVEFQSPVDGSLMMLTPEKSIQSQNEIGADIMMALDDVVSAVEPSRERIEEATHRTNRWLDRCIKAHGRPAEQNLFGIVQGGLYEDLRKISLRSMIERNLPGYAIGGLSGGEAKSNFWRVVEQCTRPGSGLPESKPRYLMGVGYPLDMLVCVALGVDMFDCVYPCRTARFGTAMVPTGLRRLKQKENAADFRPIDENCRCYTCRHYTRAFLHTIVTKEAVACHLLTLHNLYYMKHLMLAMREAILEKSFTAFARSFVRRYFPSQKAFQETSVASKGGRRGDETDATGLPESKKGSDSDEASEEKSGKDGCPPVWVREALLAAGIDIRDMYDWWDKNPNGVQHQMSHDGTNAEI